MKELFLTLLVLLCFDGRAQPASNQFEKELERLERQRNAERARGGSMEDREQGYLYFTRSLRSGDSSAQITEKLCPPWSARGTNYFVAQYPFSQWVPWTNRSLILEWQSNYELPDGRPRVVFALFSDAQKTNLVDALLYNGSEGVLPLLDGPYSRKVLAVKAGDNVEAVFRELGLRRCQYFRGKDGKWRVRVEYMTYDTHFILYEVDAGSGVILRVWDGTL